MTHKNKAFDSGLVYDRPVRLIVDEHDKRMAREGDVWGLVRSFYYGHGLKLAKQIADSLIAHYAPQPDEYGEL